MKKNIQNMKLKFVRRVDPALKLACCLLSFIWLNLAVTAQTTANFR